MFIIFIIVAAGFLLYVLLSPPADLYDESEKIELLPSSTKIPTKGG